MSRFRNTSNCIRCRSKCPADRFKTDGAAALKRLFTGQANGWTCLPYCQQYSVVEIDHVEHGKDGETKYILAHCLFDPSHTGKDAAIFQYANGSLGYKCFHSSCSSYGWKEARAKISGDVPLSSGGSRSSKAAATAPPKKRVSLADYCINNETERLRKEMREAVFIMEGVAIRGQYTAICAPPNGGKTLLTIAGLMKAVDNRQRCVLYQCR